MAIRRLGENKVFKEKSGLEFQKGEQFYLRKLQIEKLDINAVSIERNCFKFTC